MSLLSSPEATRELMIGAISSVTVEISEARGELEKALREEREIYIAALAKAEAEIAARDPNRPVPPTQGLSEAAGASHDAPAAEGAA